MEGMITQYQTSCKALRQRVGELNDRMAGRASMKKGETRQTLEARRLLLYHELWEMEEAIEAMASHCRRSGSGDKPEPEASGVTASV